MDIAVIVPCHNGAQWIERALESVRVQSRPPSQVILIDDGSTDDSVARVEAFPMEVEILSVDHRNAAATRNAGIRAATASWVAFLDADDEWYPGHLEQIAQADEAGDDAYLCACHRRYVETDEIEEFDGWPLPWPQELRSGLTHLEFLEFFSRVSSFGHSGVAVRRERTIEVGGFDEELVRRHDYEHVMRVIRDRTWTFDPQPGAVYQRDTPDSISRNVVDCDYFYLRGLANNLDGYDGELYRQWLRSRCRAAIRSALVSGGGEDMRRAHALAREFIPRWESWGIGVVRAVPGLFRFLLGPRRSATEDASRR